MLLGNTSAGYSDRMKAVTLSDAARDLCALIDQLRGGETIVITEDGVPVANLVAPPPAVEVDWEARLDRLEREGVIRRGTGRMPDPAALAAQRLNRNPTGAVEALPEERSTGQ